MRERRPELGSSSGREEGADGVNGQFKEAGGGGRERTNGEGGHLGEEKKTAGRGCRKSA